MSTARATRRSALPAPATPPPARRRDHLTVVRPDHRRRRSRAVLVLAGALVFAALFGNAVFHAVMVSEQKRLDTANQDVQTAQARQQRLQLRLAQLEAPERIVRAATAQGMQLPDKTVWLAEDGEKTESTRSTTTTTPPSTSASGGTSSGTDERAGRGAGATR